jgi:hypothetical protein
MAEHAIQQRAQRCRHTAVALEHLLVGIARVAAEDFVAPVAGQHQRAAVGARHAGTKIRRHRRGVAEGFVVGGRDLRDRLGNIGRGDVVLVGGAAEMGGGDARELHLVEAVGVEADGIGVGAAAGHAGQHAGDGRTVGAAAEEGADAVAGGRVAHRRREQFAELRRVAGIVVGRIVGVGHAPVEAGAQSAVAQMHVLRRQQLEHVAVDGGRCRHHVAVEVVVQRLRIDRRAHRRVCGHRVGGRAEHQRAAAQRIAQLLHADPIDGEQCFMPCAVDQGEREAPVQRFEQCRAAFAPGLQQRLRHAGVCGARSEVGVRPGRPAAQCQQQITVLAHFRIAGAGAHRHRGAVAETALHAGIGQAAKPLRHAADQPAAIVERRIGWIRAVEPAADLAHRSSFSVPTHSLMPLARYVSSSSCSKQAVVQPAVALCDAVQRELLLGDAPAVLAERASGR